MATEQMGRVIRLRYGGTCRQCGVQLEPGTRAEHDATTKTVRCVSCLDVVASEPASPPPVASAEAHSQEPERGTAGQSARREHERRRTRREEAIRSAHPRLGRLILAVTDEPQSTTAWEKGAVGEEKLGALLDGLTSPQLGVLHDRRIPKTRANIDHVVICPTGVVVIDAKRYRGRPRLHSQGGIFTPRVEKLMVGRRDCTKVVDGVHHQVELVRLALQGGPHPEAVVRGVLCFIDADWPLFGGSFVISGVDVLWPKKAAESLRRPGPLTDAAVTDIRDHLAAWFPVA